MIPLQPGTFDDADIRKYVDAFRGPARNVRPNYYRAAFRPWLGTPIRRVDAPVLVTWGEEDCYLGKELAELDPKLVPNGRVEYLPRTSHWVQAVTAARSQRALDRVFARVVRFTERHELSTVLRTKAIRIFRRLPAHALHCRVFGDCPVLRAYGFENPLHFTVVSAQSSSYVSQKTCGSCSVNCQNTAS